MEKSVIVEKLKEQTSTVLSFPDRGPWGQSGYRGNCSGWVHAYFLNLYNVKKMAEVFAGGGTGYDICKDMGVEYTGIDLNPNPVRPGIISMDILDESVDLPDGFYDADMLFYHPPYPGINMVKYSGSMWKDTKNLAARDIQNMSFEKGMQAVNQAVMRGYAAMQPGAYEVVLVGEIRSKGEYYSMLNSLVKPGKLHQTFVKLQHNTVSGMKTYGKTTPDRAMTGQEFIAVFKKPSGYEIAYVYPKEYKMDIRDFVGTVTWKDVVAAVARKLGSANLEQYYEEIGNHRKAKNNTNWKAKVRQTLQYLRDKGIVLNDNRGVWSYAG